MINNVTLLILAMKLKEILNTKIGIKMGNCYQKNEEFSE